MKILFLYPNNSSELRIPLAISILIAKLRQRGHDVKLFDCTFYGEFHTDNEKMAALGTHKATDLTSLVGKTIQVPVKWDLDNTIRTYKPDLICVSLVERNFGIAKDLLSDVDVPVLAGGIMPSIAPNYVIDQDWVDYICVGEGEDALVEFIERGIVESPNIWSKDYENPHRKLANLDDVPQQDWSDFDTRHLLKPFMGRVYRGGAFEFSRGCYKSCSFCVAPRLRNIYRGECYHRTKQPALSILEIEDKKNKYDLQMVAFGDTDFLNGVPKDRMREFLKLYRERINLPFTMQCSVATLLDEEVLKDLRDAKCCAISVGVESGSPTIQKQVLKKVIPTEKIKKAFDLCRTHELRVTANYMVGLPFETESDVRQTMELNRIVNPPSIAVTFFTPFIGTELYDVCIKEGFYKPYQENVYNYPPLSMPQLTQERIKELVKEFTDDFQTYQQDYAII